MDRGMDRVWVWVCDPSLMFLAVAIFGEPLDTEEKTQRPHPLSVMRLYGMLQSGSN